MSRSGLSVPGFLSVQFSTAVAKVAFQILFGFAVAFGGKSLRPFLSRENRNAFFPCWGMNEISCTPCGLYCVWVTFPVSLVDVAAAAWYKGSALSGALKGPFWCEHVALVCFGDEWATAFCSSRCKPNGWKNVTVLLKGKKQNHCELLTSWFMKTEMI